MKNIDNDKKLIPIYIYLSELMLKILKDKELLNNEELEKINFILLNDIDNNNDEKIKILINLIIQLNHDLLNEFNNMNTNIDNELDLLTFLNHYIRREFL